MDGEYSLEARRGRDVVVIAAGSEKQIAVNRGGSEGELASARGPL